MDDQQGMKPTVSVIIPCRNEQATITGVLKAVTDQTFPKDQIEMIVVDGLSTDDTRSEIAKFQASHPDLKIRLVDNPRQTIPAALNTGIDSARGDFILRLDAHSFPENDYIERSVADLEKEKGSNVGGVWLIRPGADTWMARSIACAASNPLGVGDALYRIGHVEGAVDTVPFGAFRKALIGKIGGFDETLLTNEDYEFNTRIRKSGGTVWLDPGIRSNYVARKTLGELGRQYWRYGFWKYKMLRKHPESLRWRQAIPPMFVLIVLILLIISVGSEFARILLILACGVYLIALLAASIPTATKAQDLKLIVGIPLAITTMHFSWGAGFLSSIFSLSEKSQVS